MSATSRRADYERGALRESYAANVAEAAKCVARGRSDLAAILYECNERIAAGLGDEELGARAREQRAAV